MLPRQDKFVKVRSHLSSPPEVGQGKHLSRNRGRDVHRLVIPPQMQQGALADKARHDARIVGQCHLAAIVHHLLRDGENLHQAAVHERPRRPSAPGIRVHAGLSAARGKILQFRPHRLGAGALPAAQELRRDPG
jgi:hypothetical protein